VKFLYYFNGFNSAIPEDWSDNDKLVAVEDWAGRRGYRFLPYSVDYRRAGAQAEEIVAGLAGGFAGGGGDSSSPERVIFSGSSMGGWFARVMQLRLVGVRPGLPVEALAFNPAFDLGQHGHMLLGPQVNLVTGESYEWAARHSAALGRLEASVDFDAPLPFFVYVDQGDEVIDWQRSAARHASIARFLAFAGGSHSFEHTPEALQDFDAADRH
jgi:predicted esterase YcpF (UPF0227 family)